MDPQFKTSFIPKKPITPVASRPTSTISLFVLLSTVIFIIALALSAGAFFYEKHIQTQIDAEKQSLERARSAFDPDLINKIVRLDSRLESSKKIISSHVAVTPLFDLMAKNTLRSVRFKEFNFQYLSPEKVQVTMKGQAQSYTAVALQSDQFNSIKALRGAVFSDMALEPIGTVSFNVSASIDPTLVSYSSSAPEVKVNINTVSTTTSATTSTSTKNQ